MAFILLERKCTGPAKNSIEDPVDVNHDIYILDEKSARGISDG